MAYFIRKKDLLLVFIHTLWSGMGGEGHVETDWLEQTLRTHADAKWKVVVGHHPAFPVNGYLGPYQRTIGDDYVPAFWCVLKENGVMAYLCSHILAFDVQCHEGVLQITSAGAGTAHRMPEGIEYLHAVQMAVDDRGLRYQVLDDVGAVRERLAWPLHRGMGPGGILWRSPTSPVWSSFQGISAWGLERLAWPDSCLVGATAGNADSSFETEIEAILSSSILE